MTEIPKFNFPRFHEVARKLRERGLNIISPAELDDPETEKAALASLDGSPGSGSANGEKWEDFLARDLIVTSLPTCQGGIFLEGWHRSEGAYGEAHNCQFLQKPVYEYHENRIGGVNLLEFDFWPRLEWLRSIDGGNGKSSRPWKDNLGWLEQARQGFPDELQKRIIRQKGLKL